jgi:hypothetical protein
MVTQKNQFKESNNMVWFFNHNTKNITFQIYSIKSSLYFIYQNYNEL